MTCDHCGDDVRDDDALVGEDGNSYCPECHEETHAVCEQCNAIVLQDAEMVVDGGQYCPDCFADIFTHCADCGAVVEIEGAELDDLENEVCSRCAEDYCNCDDCDTRISTENSFYDERTGQTLCECCYPISGADFPAVYFAKPMATSETNSNRAFGVELECSSCDGYECLDGEFYFGAEDDGTTGVQKEFTSAKLYGDNGLKAIRDFCREANKMNFEVDHSCGFHLHFDVSDHTQSQLFKLVLAYQLSETVWQSFVSESRRGNYFCEPLGQYVPALEYAAEKRSDFDNFVISVGTRYKWLNTRSLHKYGTFEVRLHSGTVSAEKVCNWVLAHIRFVDAVKEMSVAEIVAKFSGSDSSKFNALCQCWDSPELAAFYRGRAAKFGTRFSKFTPNQLAFPGLVESEAERELAAV